jgi:hypothetical protein
VDYVSSHADKTYELVKFMKRYFAAVAIAEVIGGQWKRKKTELCSPDPAPKPSRHGVSPMAAAAAASSVAEEADAVMGDLRDVDRLLSECDEETRREKRQKTTDTPR